MWKGMKLKMEENKISIILPTYNADEILAKAIKSVINQTYQNWELLVIENGKRGQAENIIKEFENDKIKYIYQEIANVSEARNAGLENATGKYITFLDSDDEYEKEFLEKMLKNIINSESQIAVCGYRKIYDKKQMLIGKSENIENTTDIKQYLETLKENYLFNELWNKIYISKIIKENNIKFNKKYELGEDFLFNLDYIKNIEKGSYINEPLYIYTDGDTGLKLRYRPNKFDIEYELTQYLENFYKEKNWDVSYIANRFARVYYNQIIDIYKENNPATKKEKDRQLQEIISKKEYKEELKKLEKNVTDKRMKIAIKYFFLRGKFMVKLFVVLNNIRKK